MIQVQGCKDCGNSPKNKFVQDVAVAMECGEAVPRAFSDDVSWEQPSTKPVSGKNAVLAHLGARPKPTSVTVQHAISHGKVGAASGEAILANGHTRRFCHVFEFYKYQGQLHRGRQKLQLIAQMSPLSPASKHRAADDLFGTLTYQAS